MNMRNTARILIPGMLAVMFVSCRGEGPVAEIEDSRTVQTLAKQPAPEASSAQRFGYEHRPAPGPAAQMPPGTGAPELPFTWAVPEGWEQAPDRPMRVVTFTAGPNDEVECFVAVLGQSGGGITANINRWRMQMGQDPLTEEQVAALPVIPVLGQPSRWVEIRGTFMGQPGEPIEDALMLGLICPIEQFSVFVKMTGPAAAVEAQRDNFLAFSQSLTWSEPSSQ